MNIMIGPDINGKGGIASVVSVLAEQGFLRANNVRYIASHGDGGRITKLVFAVRSIFALFWICLRSRPDIVHVHSASRASFVRKSVFLAIARGFGCKTIFHLHGAEFQQFASEEAGWLMRWWIRRTLAKSAKVIALSESWAGFLRRFSPNASVEVVANSVKFEDAPRISIEEHGRILFLGRAEQRKGIFELLAAVSTLTPSFPMIKLGVGGDGNLDAVKKRASELGVADCVEILGWIGPKQKARELARASVFCLPSYDEGLPMAMLEAMAAHKAIVVTPVGGIPEAVKDGENGLLVPPRNVVALTTALRRLLEDVELRRSLAAQAGETIRRRYSTDVVMAKLTAIYQTLSPGRAP